MEIISAEYKISSATYKQCPPPEHPEYAFIGRSNVGKSSLINMITKKKGLAKVSGTPGKTQLINHFTIHSSIREQHGKIKKAYWSLVDLPGYGYAATVSQKARNNWGNMIESYIRKRENLVCVFVLIDSRHSPQAIDIAFINQLGEWQIPFVLVFTKADKNKPGATERNVATFLKELDQTWEQTPRYFTSSALKNLGREELLGYIGGLNESYTSL